MKNPHIPIETPHASIMVSHRCLQYTWLFLTLVFMGIASCSLYWPAIISGLHSDDWGLSVPDANLWKCFQGHWFGGGHGTFYRPLSRIFIFYEARMFGYDGFAQHIISQLLFVGSVFFTAMAVKRVAGVTGALITALLIITSPIASPTVSWISCQTDLLAGFFATLSIYFVARHPADVTWRHAGLSFGAGFLCYLAKDSAATLGALGGAYFVLVGLVLGFRKFWQCKPAFFWGIIHSVFLLLYLGFRYWRLGQISGSLESTEFNPPNGMIWHYNQIYMTVLREILSPLVSLVQPVPSTDVSNAFSSCWPVCFTMVLFGWLMYKARHIEAILLAGFLATIIPLFTIGTTAYPETGLPDSSRFLYIPLFFMGALAGILLADKSDGKGGTLAGGLTILALVFVIVMQGTETQRRATDYLKAKEFRDRLVGVLNNLTDDGKQAIDVHFESLPDKFGQAYSFRNGVEGMVRVWFPGSVAYRKGQPGYLDKPVDSRPAYFIKTVNNSEIRVEPLPKNNELRDKTLRSRIKVDPVVLDCTAGPAVVNRLSVNSDAEIIDSSGTLILNVTGRDAVVMLPVPATTPYYLHRHLVVDLEFLDTAQASQSGVAQIIWALKSDNNILPSVDVVLPFSPGPQTVVFNLSGNIEWYREGDLKWIRFDIPGNYRGRVRLSRIEFR